MVNDPERPVRLRREVFEHRFAGEQCLARVNPAVLGAGGQVFAIDNCSGLYLSTGNTSKDVPGQQIEHYTWMPVERSSSFTHIIGFTFNRPVSDFTHPVTLMTYGKSRLVMERSSVPGSLQLHL